MLIRRVAISVNPRTEVASLIGRQWLAFLDKTLKVRLLVRAVVNCWLKHLIETPPF